MYRVRTSLVHDHFGTGGGRLRCSPVSVHEVHAESACNNNEIVAETGSNKQTARPTTNDQ